MITVSDTLMALLKSSQAICVDLLTITPPGLSAVHLTSADLPITVDGVMYQSWGARISRGRTKLVVGMDTDTLDLTLMPDPAGELALNGVPLRQAAARGMLGGAAVRLSWCYLSSWGPPPVVAGVLLRWVGTIGTTKVGRDSIQCTVNNPFYRLDMQVPSRVYGAPCRWTLGDAGCGVNVSNYAQTAVVNAGATDRLIPVSLAAMAQGWSGGRLTLITGDDQGVSRSIQSYDGSTVVLATALPWSPAAGDKVTVTPGCDKAAGGVSCAAYGNTQRFGGQPWIPAPETAYTA